MRTLKIRTCVANLQNKKGEEKLEGNNGNNTAHRRKTRLFRGKTKHILLLLPAILILTCILALPLASGQNQTLTIPLLYSQIQANALPQTNGINSKGDILTLANPITLGSTTNNGVPLTVIGSMTVTGDSILNGDLDISNAQQVILGSPLYASGTMTLTGDKIELGKPCSAGGLITIQGNDISPAENIVYGTLTVGNIITGSEVYLNVTNYYQYVDSQGGGYIGDWNSESNDFIVPNSAEIMVHSGELYIYGEDVPSPNILAPIFSIEIWINHDWFNIYIDSLIDVDDSVYLWGAGANAEENYNGIVNVTRMAENGEFPDFIIVDVNDVILEMGETPARYLQFDGGTVFESWGDWFAVGSSEGEGGVMVLDDSYVYMSSADSITYQFLNEDENAAITIEGSSTYQEARMEVSTTDQSITGLGNSIITNGGVSALGVSDIRNVNQITEGTFEFTGDMLINGDSTIEGDIKITGYNKLQAPITVSGQMDVNNGQMSGTLTLSLSSGSMETNGELNIEDGEMNILQGTMEMNSTGLYLYDASDISIEGSITSTGIMVVTGNPSIQGNIGISGYNYMQGLITVQGNMNINNGLTKGTLTLTIASTMETDGSMTITNGEISIPNGNMVMNETGSYITGDTITVKGDQIVSLGTTEANGDITIQGDNIGISGHSYMQGNVGIRYPLFSLNGVMDTRGVMTITNGEISIPNGNMVMNETGSYITGDTIMVTGTVDFNGNATITGDIGISGHNYMQGNVNVAQLSLNGEMVTDGDMSIAKGEINVQNGHMVMNETGSYITSTGNTITVTGKVDSNGNNTIRGDFAMGGTSYIKGPVSISGSLNINSGTMTGTGTITVSNGYMQTVGNMNIRNGTVTVSGKILMNPSGTYIGSETSITGETITVNGIVTNAGSVKMTGTFLLMIPMSITGVMVTNGITAMGGLGTINGVMNVMGDIMMSGMTMISGDNNIMGSMTVMPGGVAIYGLVGLTGMVYTSSMPAIGPTTILEIPSGSMMGLSIPHVSILMNPLALVALGILGIGTVYVVGKAIYFGIKERRTLIQLVRIYGREMGRSISEGIKKLFRGFRSRASE